MSGWLAVAGLGPGDPSLVTPEVTAALSHWLAGFTGEAVELRPDLDQIPALAAERDQHWARVGAASFLTDAEKRAAAGERMPVLVLDYPGLVDIGDQVKESPWAAPGLCHADELETSMMLAISPGTVHPERFAAEYPELPPDFGQRPQALAPLGETGVFGDPRAATAAKGEQIIAHVVTQSLAAIERTLRSLGLR